MWSQHRRRVGRPHGHAVAAGGSGGGGGLTGLPVIEAALFANDGIVGNGRRALGFVPFPPPGSGAVHAADLTSLSGWTDNDVEVALFLEDVGARHLGLGDDTALLGVHTQAVGDFAAPGDVVPITFRFDRPVTLARLTKQAYSEFSNPLTIALSGDGLKFRLNAACTAYVGDEDAPRRVPAGDFVWSAITAGGWTIPIDVPIAAPASGFTRVTVFLTLDFDGTLRAYPRSKTSASAIADAAFANDIHDDWNRRAFFNQQILGYAYVFIGPTASAWTPATSGLAATGVTASLSASGQTKPYSVLPEHFVPVSLTPTDPTYLSASCFPGFPMLTAADERALGGTHASYDIQLYTGSTSVWMRGASSEYLNNTAATWYNYQLVEWCLFARSGLIRHYRRSLSADATLRAYRTDSGGNFVGRNEANMDVAGFLYYYLLTSPSDGATVSRAYAKRTYDDQEYAQIKQFSSTLSNGTTRYGMHVFEGSEVFARAGIDPGKFTDGAFYPPMSLAAGGGHDDNAWPEAGTYVNVTGALARAQKMTSRFHNYMVSTAISGTTDGVANATSLRRLHMTDPLYTDVSTFMLGWDLSNICRCADVFGAQLPLAQIEQDVGDALEFCFSAVRTSDGTPAMYDQTPGKESFVYSLHNVINLGTPTQNNGLIGVNATLLYACGWMYRRTSNVLWKNRGLTLWAAQRTTAPGYFSKELAEGAGWLGFAFPLQVA
jgi:hypothetical protein